MKLFLVHAGFYDANVSGGFYESHTNYFVVAKDVKEAKSRAKEIKEYKIKKCILMELKKSMSWMVIKLNLKSMIIMMVVVLVIIHMMK